jgi:hypothetical protein
MTFAENFANAINNPSCDIMSGMVIGNWMMVKNLIIIFLIYTIFKALDVIVVSDLLIKLKIWTQRRIKGWKKGWGKKA